MTQDELDTLADVTPGVGQRIDVVNGRRVVTPVFEGETGAFFQKDDDGLYEDRQGRCWFTGWLNGRHVKRRKREYERHAEA